MGGDAERLTTNLARRTDGAAILGYLNFADGRADPKFRRATAELFAHLAELGDPTPWLTAPLFLRARLAALRDSGAAAFRDTSQAEAVIERGLVELPAAYREFHRDLLAHQPESVLFAPFFLARCCEVALGLKDAPVGELIKSLNDYVGYRPIAVLETRPQTDYYPHEKVAPIPLWWQNVGAAPGRYADLIRPALELLDGTDRHLLEEASFDPANLEELCLDPRAIDHFHPVTKRPSVLFGEWDPQRIDGRGYFRRFVLRQITFDALSRWVHGEKWPNTTGTHAPDAGRLLEAAAALCGTILMGAGVSGSGPTAHDSMVTLSDLVQRIARYRDEFYKRLITGVPGPTGERLRAEAARFRQPFAGVRQYLNQAIAQERALHLQERRLALLFAAMGYPGAARARAARIPAPATRFGTEIRIRQTEAGATGSPLLLAARAKLLSEVEDLLKRGIDCGALIDPWNILGYQGLFPIFPGSDDTVRDPRAEDLILTAGRQFDAYAHALAAAAAGPDRAVEEQIRTRLKGFANWWDKFATDAVSDLPHVKGRERLAAADHVAKATALWRTGPANDPAFWRKHREGFRTAPAFAQVIETLLARPDYAAALALLMAWLSEADSVPLADPGASFVRLAFRWVRGVASRETQGIDHPALVRRFFELLEANADDRWRVPTLGLDELAPPPREVGDAEPDADAGDTFASAYEGVTFQDSADDGQEGAVADGKPQNRGDFPLDGEADGAEERLRFLAAVARLWRAAARPDLWDRNDPATVAAVAEWLVAARTNLADLNRLIARLVRVEVPEPTTGLEGVMEYDRRRAVRGSLLELSVQTAVETSAASRSLAALLPRLPQLGTPGPTDQLAGWEALATRLERAVTAGEAAGCRRLLPTFLQLFRHEPLLVSPPADGGAPAAALRAQTALNWIESLLARLPRIGLLRETYQLLKLARQMERNSPPSGRRVSSFDQLFRTAVVGIVDALLVSVKDWGDAAGEDGRPAAALRQMADSFRALWVDHSIGLRLSTLEAVADADDWDDLSDFVREFGGDLFTVRFLTLSNVRGILGQGPLNWLERQAREADPRPKLVEAVAARKTDPARAARQFEVVLQSLVEHYDEYRDYNTTTTQSDYGENLYILLDFLRLKAQYDRYAWRLKPMVLVHEVLCRRGFDRLAAKWREFLSAQSTKTANDLLAQLAKKEAEHAVKLRTIRDRLEERFLQTLKVDQAAAKVARASASARDGQPEDNPAFTGLLAAVQPLAEHPSGVGLDVPTWLRRLEDELRRVRAGDAESDAELTEPYPQPATRVIDPEELRRQLREWERPID